jgi:hypothetical protein
MPLPVAADDQKLATEISKQADAFLEGRKSSDILFLRSKNEFAEA